jgi:hypothetical protein
MFSGDEPAKKIKFFRPSLPGNVLDCSVQSEAKSVTTMTAEDGSKTEKAANSRINISGVMTVRTVTDFGRPGTLEFKVVKVDGESNGTAVNFACAGKTLEANLESKPCEIRIKGGGAEIGDTEKQLLSLVFRPTRKENLSDFIGTDKEIKIGDTWDTPLTPIENELEKRKLKKDELKIEGKVKLADRKQVEGYDCWIFDAGLNARKNDDFEFGFKAEVSLPVDEGVGAVRLSRDGIEKIAKKITDKDNPIMPGVKEIVFVITDKMRSVIRPVKEKGN